MEQLKRRVQAAIAAIAQQQKEDLLKQKEGRAQALAVKAAADATASVKDAEDKITKAVAAVGAGGVLLRDLDIGKLESIKASIDDAMRAASEAKAMAAKAVEARAACQNLTNGERADAQTTLRKLALRAFTAEKRCGMGANLIRAAYADVIKLAKRQVRGLLRLSVQKSGKSFSELFDEMAAGEGELNGELFRKHLTSVPVHGLKRERLSLALEEIGTKRQKFEHSMQEFWECTKEVTVSDTFQTETPGTIGTLAIGDVMEILDGPTEETETKAIRVQGRRMKDNLTGWFSVRDAKRTFMKLTERPLLWCTSKTDLCESTSSSSSPVVREIQRDEILELQEGPYEEHVDSILYLRVSTATGIQGWITLRDADSVFATPSTSMYTCRSAIALTDNFDIKNCNIVCKVKANESLMAIQGETEKMDDSKSVRLHVKAVSDGKQGWVTLRGSQGTVFVEASKSHYAVGRACSLRKTKAVESDEVKKLEVGETLEALEPPKEEMPPRKLAYRVRALQDGNVGWISYSSAAPIPVLRPWSRKYVCKAAVDFTATLSCEGSAPIGQAKPGECFSVVEGPLLDPASGVRRVRCLFSKYALGWASLCSNGGEVFLEAT